MSYFPSLVEKTGFEPATFQLLGNSSLFVPDLFGFVNYTIAQIYTRHNGGRVMVFYVLYDDGTWAGGFTNRLTAEDLARKHNGQVVKGRWFDNAKEPKA